MIKFDEKNKAIQLRLKSYALNKIATELGVSKSSVSIWVRDVKLSSTQVQQLKLAPFTDTAIENRRNARLNNEHKKRQIIISHAMSEIPDINTTDLWLMGIMLYWAEGGKTQRMVRFSNGDPNMIKIMVKFFLIVCNIPQTKLRGYIHIHIHIHIHQSLDHKKADYIGQKYREYPWISSLKPIENLIRPASTRRTLSLTRLWIYISRTLSYLIE